MASLRHSRAVAVALVSFATFTDMVAYSVAVPVLPDLSRRLGASPTMIGLLFASFGVTLLCNDGQRISDTSTNSTTDSRT